MFREQLSFLGDLTKPLITSCSSRVSASAKELRHRGSLASLICPSHFILSHYLLPSLLTLYLLSEKAMAPHSSTLAWEIPWMEEPGRL